MGTGAFSVLLLRLTQKRFSATQYALFSSLFGLPRLLAGPISGFLVDADRLAHVLLDHDRRAASPGLLLLARFVPLGRREPEFIDRAAVVARAARDGRARGPRRRGRGDRRGDRRVSAGGAAVAQGRRLR